MTDRIAFSVADADVYSTPDETAQGRPYRPACSLDGWNQSTHGAWVLWRPPADELALQGWKVHVSARPERADAVLDIVAAVCRTHSVAFKHLRTDWLFRWQHHKHGDRTQSGKFCTVYPHSVAAARAVMADLADALRDEDGPTPLTDRAFGGSRVVSYRYGAFQPRRRLNADGTTVLMMLDGNGSEVTDSRSAGFALPDGIADPFQSPVAVRTEGDAPRIGRYRFTRLVSASNAGCGYAAVDDDGRDVFVKQARPHNGYHWDGSTARDRLRREYDVLRTLHEVCPGVAPEPLDLLSCADHDYLMTELVPGRTLWAWNALANPLARTDTREHVVAAHFDRCRRLLDRLACQLDRLHAAGYVFVDLNPGNVLIDEQDRPRLVDFEATAAMDRPIAGHGAAGYVSPAALTGATHADARHLDDYGLAALTQLLIHPAHPALDRNPATAAHLRAALPAVPDDLWRRATRFRPTHSPSILPTPEEVADEPVTWLRWLRDRTVRGLQQSVDPTAERPVRTVPAGLVVHPAGLAHGTAGVVHALHYCGAPVDDRLIDALLACSRRDDTDLAPGLLTGGAGIAWALADQGHLDIARSMVLTLAEHPLLHAELTVSDGCAGVALAALHVDQIEPDERLVEVATRLLVPAPSSDVLATMPSGWRRGAAGLALAQFRLARRIDDDALVTQARATLRADLRHLSPTPTGGALFHVSDTDRRLEPYIAAGSAGFALVAARILDHDDTDPALETACTASTTAVRGARAALLPSLFEGIAGLSLALTEVDVLHPAAGLRPDAERLARSLFTHAVDGPDGSIRFFGGPEGRFSDDLAYGAAGIAVALHQLLTGRVGALFTLDDPPPVG